MERASKGQPRRRPKRESGRQIFQAILGATNLLLNEDERVTTHRIAERAGVSIGSLYRYFQDRNAILAELVRSKETWAQGQAADWANRSEGLPLEQVVQRLVDAAMEETAAQRGARRSMVLELPPSLYQKSRRAKALAFEALIAGHLVRFEGLDPQAAQRCGFQVYHGVDGIIRAAVVDCPERLQDPLFRKSTAAMVLALVHANSAPPST